MTVPTLTAFLDGLERTARAASATEDAFRREAMQRIRALEDERAFAFRRVNFMRSVAAAVAGAKDEAEAEAKGAAAFFHELDWSGATEAQRQAQERFRPVVAAVWAASQPDAGDDKAEALARELADFEHWFAQSRNAPFLTMLGREVVELPLVEVS